MVKGRHVLFTLICLFTPLLIQAQGSHATAFPQNFEDTSSGKRDLFARHHEMDIIDVALEITHKTHLRHVDSAEKKKGKLYIAPLPGIGYSLNTGIAAVVNTNFAFYTSGSPKANISTIVTSVNYTQMNQFILPVISNIWIDDNKYNIQGNWLYAKFPQATYGLGGYTTLNDAYNIDYSNLRLQTALYKAVAQDLLVGVGYTYEYFWNTSEVSVPEGQVTDMKQYGFSPASTSSAITLNLLYDNRRNSITPEGGSYANINYRPNMTLLGSDANWQSLVVDLRKYIHLPGNTKNILAFWSYDWLTFGADKAPYVLLPNTGGDPYNNTGRGYSPGRFRGNDMVYLESEYRYQILKNGLLGGVVFCNAESFTEPGTSMFSVIHPGYGAGLRVRFNKYSRINIALDYGFGNDGSHGFFLNLGEIF